MASPESFLTLEYSLAQRLTQDWRRRVALPVIRQIQAAVARGDFTHAQTLARKLTFTPTIDTQLGYIETVGVQSYMLGQSFFAGDVKDGQLASGKEQVPMQVERSAQAFANGLRAAENEIIDAALKVISTAEAGVKKAAIPGFASLLNKAVASGGAGAFDVGANLSTSRLVNYGALSEAQARGVTIYQVSEVLDRKTCPVCRRMHGKTWSVQPAMDSLESALMTDDPAELASTQPFTDSSKKGLAELDRMTEAEMVSRGWNIPPYHPHCRGIVVKAGTVPETEKWKAPPAPFPKPKVPKPKPKKPPKAVDIDQPVTVTGPTPMPPKQAPKAQPYVAESKAVDTAQMWQHPETGEWHPIRVSTVHDSSMARLRKGFSPIPAEEQGTYHMMGGGSGAGKGTVIRKGHAKPKKGSIIVDSDAIKANDLPEYAARIARGDETAAAFAHNESSFLSTRAVREGIDDHFDVLLDGTGDGSIAKLKGRLAPARSKGYRVTADYVDIPTDMAVDRAVLRAIQEGRMVPEGKIRLIHRDVSVTLNKATKQNLFDDVRLWDNSGGEPLLVMEQKAGKMVVHEKKLWDDFLKKADEDVMRITVSSEDNALIRKAIRWKKEGKSTAPLVEQYKAGLVKRGRALDRTRPTQVKQAKLTVNPNHPKIDPRYRLDDEGKVWIDGSSNAPWTKGAGYTADENAAFRAYQGEHYAVINGYLRQGVGYLKGSTEAFIAQTKKYADDLIKAINKARLQKPLTVYRGSSIQKGGIGKPRESLTKLFNSKPGYVFSDTGFPSYTLDRQTSAMFARTSKDIALSEKNGSFVLRLRLKEGDRVLWGGKVEHEFLLPPGQTYRVVGVQKNVDIFSGFRTRLIDVEIVPKRIPAKFHIPPKKIRAIQPVQQELPFPSKFPKIDLNAKYFDPGVETWVNLHSSPQVLADKAAKFTGKMVKAAHEYTAMAYRHMNRLLRLGPKTAIDMKGATTAQIAARLKEIRGYVSRLRAAINKTSLSRDFTAYRGTAASRATTKAGEEALRLRYRQLKPGFVFEEQGFGSVTLKKAVAEQFADAAYVNAEAQSRASVIYRVNLKKGQKALWSGEGEAEFILPDGMMYRVTKVQKNVKWRNVEQWTDKGVLPQTTRVGKLVDLEIVLKRPPPIPKPKIKPVKKVKPKPAVKHPKIDKARTHDVETDLFVEKSGPYQITSPGSRQQGMTNVVYTAEEDQMFVSYTKTGYQRINSYMRDPAAATPAVEELGGKEAVDFLKRKISVLKGAVEKSPLAQDLTAYRGASPNLAKTAADKDAVRRLYNIKPGQVYQEKAFSSVTLNREVASDFAWAGQTEAIALENEAFVVRVRLKKGDKGLWAGSAESEVLLPEGMTYRVVKVTDGVEMLNKRFVRLIDVEIVPKKVIPIPKKIKPVPKPKKKPVVDKDHPKIDIAKRRDDEAFGWAKDNPAPEYWREVDGVKVYSAVEQKAASEYVSSKYLHMNRILRYGVKQTKAMKRTTEAIIDKAAANLKILQKIVRQQPLSRDFTVYRGLHPKRATLPEGAEALSTLFKNVKPGYVWTDKGFSSFSIDRQTASQFAAAQDLKVGVASTEESMILRVRMKKGDPAMWMGGSEGEFVLPDGMTFRVVKVTRNARMVEGRGVVGKLVDVEIVPKKATQALAPRVKPIPKPTTAKPVTMEDLGLRDYVMSGTNKTVADGFNMVTDYQAQDILQVKIAKKLGMDKKPVLLNPKDFDEFLKKNPKAIEMHRGVQSFGARDATSFANDLKVGKAFYGRGVSGSGIYTSERYLVAEGYAGIDGAVVRMALMPSAKTNTIENLAYAMNKKMLAFHAKIDPKIVEAAKRVASFTEGSASRVVATRQWQRLVKLKERVTLAEYTDVGRFAMLHGYDAIEVGSHMKHWVVLNRNMLVVEA